MKPKTLQRDQSGSSIESGEYQEIYERLHADACARQEHTYSDPQTGFTVITRVGHLARGSCCGSGCRHCAWVNADKASKERS